MATTRQNSPINSKDNRRACCNCKRTFHRNSVKRHELICSNSLNKGFENKMVVIGQESKLKRGSPKRIRLDDKEDEDFVDIRSRLRSSTTIIKPEEPVKTKTEKSVKKEAVQVKTDNDNVKLSQGVAANNTKVIKEEPDDDLVCLLCDQPINKGNLESHYKLNHTLGSNRSRTSRKVSSSNVQNGLNGSSMDYNSKRFKCEICRKMFDKSIHWCHYKEHHNMQKVHRCSECNLKFSYVQNLLYHKSVDHLKEMYKSKYCQRKDKDKESNNGQINSDHSSDQSSVSSSSGSSNSSSSSCNSVSSNSPRSSIDSTSSSYDDSNSHRHSRRSVQITDSERKVRHTCPVDNKNFDCILDLLDHIRQSHHWTRSQMADSLFEPDLFCPECGLEFVVKPTLVKHLKVSHEDSLSVLNVKAYMERAGYGSRPLLPYQCQVCFQVLDSQISFNIHRRTHGLAFLSFLKSSM